MSKPYPLNRRPPTYVRIMLRLLGVLGLLLPAGCVPDHVTDYDFKALQPPLPEIDAPDYELVGETEAGGVTVRVLAYRGLHTGYNALRVGLEAGGAAIAEANITLTASLEEPASSSGAVEMPVEAPPARAGDAGFFDAGTLLLPADSGATVTLDLAFETGDGQQGTASFEAPVAESLWMQRGGPEEAPYTVNWVRPLRPTVGENEFEVVLYGLTTDGPVPVTDAAIDLYPYMDMGGGDGHSTPFHAPEPLGGGRYRGTVNFIMSGGWDMTVYIDRPGRDRESVLFDDYTVF